MAIDAVTAIADAAGALFKVTDSVIALFPDYEQKKKEEYFKLRTSYTQEKNKAAGLRDLNFLLSLKLDLLNFTQTFYKELENEGIKLK